MGAVVLSLDAGFAATGAVLVEFQPWGATVIDTHCFRTGPDGRKRGLRVADSDAQRCATLTERLVSWTSGSEIAACVVELPNGGAQNGRAARAMGMATGLVAATVTLMRWPTEWVTPDAVKVAATGKRQASKAEVQAGVRERLRWGIAAEGTQAEWEHIADAAGAYLAAADGALIRALRGRGA